MKFKIKNFRFLVSLLTFKSLILNFEFKFLLLA